MMKKVFLSLPFMLGIGVIVLVVATAVALARQPCDGFEPDGKETEKNACVRQIGYSMNSCNKPGVRRCVKSTGVFGQEAWGTTERFFSTTYDWEKLQSGNLDVGVKETELRCASWWNCKNNHSGSCITVSRVFENGAPKYFYILYYEDVDCIPVGGGGESVTGSGRVQRFPFAIACLSLSLWHRQQSLLRSGDCFVCVVCVNSNKLRV